MKTFSLLLAPKEQALVNHINNLDIHLSRKKEKSSFRQEWDAFCMKEEHYSNSSILYFQFQNLISFFGREMIDQQMNKSKAA